MEISKFFEIIETEDHELNESQKKVIEHGNGPLWVIAGPGSGKTQVLVLRTLKLIFVDNVNPKSIILTTFTEKAAKNLFDRILKYSSLIKDNFQNLNKVNLHDIHIGTLHSICNNILLEYNYPPFENYKLLDQNEQKMFIYEHSAFVNTHDHEYLPFFRKFEYLFNTYDDIGGYWDKTKNYLPNKWNRTKAAEKLFNRMIEDGLDFNKIKNSEDEYIKILFEFYNDYVDKLDNNKRCDFAHLQKKFLDFLESPLGEKFINEDSSREYDGIEYVLVDEYQDTNPLQEIIYLKLASKCGNICVVGDDDQALYRFRGGTVDCMVTFKEVFEDRFKRKFPENSKIFLNYNYRSHPNIVDYCNKYISSFDSMKIKNARVDDKPFLEPKINNKENYPAVAYIWGRTIEKTAQNFAKAVKYFLDHGIIQYPSQCVLLMNSTKEGKYNSYFINSLKNLGIGVYNPRSKSFIYKHEIKLILGAIISIVDPNLFILQNEINNKAIVDNVEKWVEYYKENSKRDLQHYVETSIDNISKLPIEEDVGVNILEIFYRVISREPIKSCRNDFEMSYRIGKLSKLFESFSSTPRPDFPELQRGQLRISSEKAGKINKFWLIKFYFLFIGLLISEGIDDPENDEIPIPQNKLPLLTVHQSKGLEFQIVFVYNLKQTGKKNDSILLEDYLMDFRSKQPFFTFDYNNKNEHDNIRFYYVAYSRAQDVLIHLVPENHLQKGSLGLISAEPSIFKDNVEKID